MANRWNDDDSDDKSTSTVPRRIRPPTKLGKYAVAGVVSNGRSIRGRKTLVYAVHAPNPSNPNQLMALKLSWRVARHINVITNIEEKIRGLAKRPHYSSRCDRVRMRRNESTEQILKKTSLRPARRDAPKDAQRKQDKSAEPNHLKPHERMFAAWTMAAASWPVIGLAGDEKGQRQRARCCRLALGCLAFIVGQGVRGIFFSVVQVGTSLKARGVEVRSTRSVVFIGGGLAFGMEARGVFQVNGSSGEISGQGVDVDSPPGSVGIVRARVGGGSTRLVFVDGLAFSQNGRVFGFGLLAAKESAPGAHDEVLDAPEKPDGPFQFEELRIAQSFFEAGVVLEHTV
ncbi:hypothetical protein BJ138DRAFT_1120208 [Hygrophoropsis aurantiaca]|uniref:Uncharacterized protein n=1 Tax=Hygrophoropsis aurantiaca TaxID=72124 RepID=A0ACB7ZSF9_9AGAM|nr:hypothetical protein BJ138DRAFT_1120208 [Hygrophoropsis aurantiaca]